jgi:2C-methyl-D-erythritol 2,4-cyclodiphosphate synthase
MDPAVRDAILDGMETYFAQHPFNEDEYKRAEADSTYALDHEAEWRVRYPNYYVAVYDSQLIAAAPTIDELHDAVRQANVPVMDCHVRFIWPEKYIYML